MFLETIIHKIFQTNFIFHVKLRTTRKDEFLNFFFTSTDKIFNNFWTQILVKITVLRSKMAINI